MNILKFNLENIEALNDTQIEEVIQTIASSEDKKALLIHLSELQWPGKNLSEVKNLRKVITPFKEDYKKMLEEIDAKILREQKPPYPRAI